MKTKRIFTLASIAVFLCVATAENAPTQQPPQKVELKQKEIDQMWANIDSTLANTCAILLPNGSVRGLVRTETDELRANVVILSNLVKQQDETIKAQKIEIEELKKQIPPQAEAAPAPTPETK